MIGSPSKRLLWFAACVLLVACSAEREALPPVLVEAPPLQQAPVSQPAPTVEPSPARARLPIATPERSYMGREIAQTVHWTGAEWLIRETREDEENASALLDALALQPGQTVCDLGCGNGYHTLRIAERVGDEGRVLAVELQPQMLTLLRRRAEEAGVDNVEYLVSTETDPRLAEGSCDLILLVDVYHELADPEPVLAALRKALRPGGRVALVEFRAEDPDVPIKPLHKMSKEQIRREWTANGFQVAGEFDELPWQHLVFLTPDAR